MAAVIDGGSIFRNKTYFLEGDGALIFVAYDTIMSLFAFIDNPQWDNVDAVIEGLVANLPNSGSETPQSTCSSCCTARLLLLPPKFHN